MARTVTEQRPVVEQDPNAEAQDTVLGWLAMNLPSWGTSVMFHAAVFLMAAFFSTADAGERQAPFKYTTAVVSEKKYTLAKPPTRAETAQPQKSPSVRPGEGGEASRGKTRPEISGLLKAFTVNPFPDVASNGLKELEVIGMRGGGRQIGGLDGLGNGSGLGTGTGGGGPRFFITGGQPGPEENASRIVYVVDRSGSMTDSIFYVKMELKRSINELGPDKQFHIIFYSSGPAHEMPARRLVTATESNKEKAFDFVDGIVAGGETDPSDALQRAFAVKPDLIYFLTDGEFDKAIVDQIRLANPGKKVIVSTIGFLYGREDPLLRKIAEENGGNFKFVSEADLAVLGQ